jgi:1-acyl-sn-glycerol-3-phosphate acyltransferase
MPVEARGGKSQKQSSSSSSEGERERDTNTMASQKEEGGLVHPFSDKMPVWLLRVMIPLHLMSMWYWICVVWVYGWLLNAVQLVITILGVVGVLSRPSATDWCQRVATEWWKLLTWAVEVWGHVCYRYTGDLVRYGESCLVMGNHGAGIDFVSAVGICNHIAGSGKCMTMLKKSLVFVPLIGTHHYFQGSLFLNRKWEEDKDRIAARCAAMERGDYRKPVMWAMYPEGTRITPQKRELSQQFARERGNLPLLKHVLLPRTKGFKFVCKHLPTAVSNVTDCTVGYRQHHLALADILKQGFFSCAGVDVHVRRIPWSELPVEDDEKLSAWLIDDFKQKDELLEHLETHGKYPGNHVREMDCPLLSLTYRFLLASTVCNLLLFFCLPGVFFPSGYQYVFYVQAYTALWGFFFRKSPTEDDTPPSQQDQEQKKDK